MGRISLKFKGRLWKSCPRLSARGVWEFTLSYVSAADQRELRLEYEHLGLAARRGASKTRTAALTGPHSSLFKFKLRSLHSVLVSIKLQLWNQLLWEAPCTAPLPWPPLWSVLPFSGRQRTGALGFSCASLYCTSQKLHFLRTTGLWQPSFEQV